MIDVDTEIVPPGLDVDNGGEPDPMIHIHLGLIEGDDTHRGASATVPASSTDTELVDALMSVLAGLATMRGPGLVAALADRIRSAP